MPRPKKKTRIYTRQRGGETRYYADFRDYADVGGGREALKAPDEKLATTDFEVAEKLVSDRLDQLREKRKNKGLHGPEALPTPLKLFAAEHLVDKAQTGDITESRLESLEHMLSRAVEFFGADRDVASIGADDVTKYIAWLKKQPSGRRGADGQVRTLSGGTIRHYLTALSNLYRRAQSAKVVPPGYNPVAATMDKPTHRREEARWLEIHEAALLLEAARTYTPKEAHAHLGIGFAYELIAAFLLTGGRETEVLGLTVDDINFTRKTVTFRPNKHRRLKTLTSHRVVPLWPQLDAILRDYLARTPRTGLLFPSSRGKKEALITDFRKILDAVAIRTGWQKGEIRSRMFRHTYCATRLQTLDGGAPVSPFTVARELGHGGDAMIRKVYGHLGRIRHRSEEVEYRVEQHEKELKPRLMVLRGAA